MRTYATDNSARRATGLIWLLVAMLAILGCGGRAPKSRPETAAFMPDDVKGIYLGMERKEIDRLVPAQSTQLTDDGLETVTEFLKDSVHLGLALAYRDERLSTATIWYDYSLVPGRIDRDRPAFLAAMIRRNGPNYQPCSFVMPGADFVPDIGLYWTHPGFRVAVTFAKPSGVIPDSVESRPYFQFSMFDSVTSVVDLWPNVVIPADPAELRFFHEVDSLRDIVRAQQPLTP